MRQNLSPRRAEGWVMGDWKNAREQKGDRNETPMLFPSPSIIHSFILSPSSFNSKYDFSSSISSSLICLQLDFLFFFSFMFYSLHLRRTSRYTDDILIGCLTILVSHPHTCVFNFGSLNRFSLLITTATFLLYFLHTHLTPHTHIHTHLRIHSALTLFLYFKPDCLLKITDIP